MPRGGISLLASLRLSFSLSSPRPWGRFLSHHWLDGFVSSGRKGLAAPNLDIGEHLAEQLAALDMSAPSLATRHYAWGISSAPARNSG